MKGEIRSFAFGQGSPTQKLPGETCYVEATVQNTGNVPVEAVLGFTIYPPGVPGVDAPYSTPVTLAPGEVRTLTSNIATVPVGGLGGIFTAETSFAHWIGDPPPNDVVWLDFKSDSSAYEIPAQRAGTISSLTWMQKE